MGVEQWTNQEYKAAVDYLVSTICDLGSSPGGRTLYFRGTAKVVACHLEYGSDPDGDINIRKSVIEIANSVRKSIGELK